MKYFLYKLISPYTAISRDAEMTEATIFESHHAYWNEQIEKGSTLVFGPVADPNGAYSIAILCVDEGSDPGNIVAGDPALTSLAGFRYEIHEMPGALAREG
jgi:hypothetical protein